MLSWLAKKMLDRNMVRASAGDIGPTLKMDAKDVRFRFPGDSSWATELQGKEKLETCCGASPIWGKALDEYLMSVGKL